MKQHEYKLILHHEAEQRSVAVDVETILTVPSLGQDCQHPIQVIDCPPHLQSSPLVPVRTRDVLTSEHEELMSLSFTTLTSQCLKEQEAI